MDRKELKKEAKEVLKGRWGTAIGMFLLYELIMGAIAGILNVIPVVGQIVLIIISVPMAFGFAGQMLKFVKKEDVGICDFFTIGFNNLGKSWAILGNKLLKMLPYFITYIISAFAVGMAAGFAANNVANRISLISLVILLGIVMIITYIFLIVKMYLYILSDYIGNEELDLSGKQVVQKSELLMNGHRWEFFVLNLSFIGWILLAIVTLGIGLLWLIPYMQVTMIKYYQYRINNFQNINANKTRKNIGRKLTAGILIAIILIPTCYTTIFYVMNYFIK